LLDAMDAKLLAVLNILVWSGNRKLDELEAELGFELGDQKICPPRHHYERERKKFIPRPGFYWVVYEEYSSGYYGEVEFIVGLPRAIRSVFKQRMPKPKGYNVEPLAELPEGVLTYRCEAQLAEDLRMTSDYIARGHLQFNKNETIKKQCIRAVAGLTAAGEFFAGEKRSAKLPLLRHELLTGLVASCGPKLRKAMLNEPPDPAELLRPLCDTLFENPTWFHELLLAYLKIRGWENYDKQALANLRGVFAMLPEDQWVAAANLESIVDFREIDLDIMSRSRLQVTISPESAGYDYSSRIEIDQSNGWRLFIVPLIQGTAFLLAALGLAEIAYTLPPAHPRWKRPSEDFLTPFDGLYAIRLTPAGAYAFGLRKEVELKGSTRERAEIILTPQRLTATCRHIDPITEMSLLEYMEKVSDGCYRMTRQSLMRGCCTKGDVEKRVATFRQHITVELPPFWEAFFESTVQSAVALSAKIHYKVYELAESPELRRLFMRDPVLCGKTLKVEGMRVAIKKGDETAVQKRLNALGYLMR